MAPINPDLIEAVEHMGPDEFDAFIEQAFSLRAPAKAGRLSALETQLIKRINRGLSEKSIRRNAQLVRRRKKRALTEEEHRELLRLTHEMESRDVERAQALLELARLRQVPIRLLMKQMGIKAAPVHG